MPKIKTSSNEKLGFKMNCSGQRLKIMCMFSIGKGIKIKKINMVASNRQYVFECFFYAYRVKNFATELTLKNGD
jgi:hypothetical protein